MTIRGFFLRGAVSLATAVVGGIPVANALLVEGFDANLTRNPQDRIEPLHKADWARSLMVNLFRMGIAEHLRYVRSNANPEIARPENLRYQRTVYELIPTEIAKAFFDIKTSKDDVYYNDTSKELIELAKDAYEDVTLWTQENYNYLIFINTIKQALTGKFNDAAALLQSVSHLIKTEAQNTYNVDMLNKAYKDVLYYLIKLDLARFLVRFAKSKFKEELHKVIKAGSLAGNLTEFDGSNMILLLDPEGKANRNKEKLEKPSFLEDGERYNIVLDVWSRGTYDRLIKVAMPFKNQCGGNPNGGAYIHSYTTKSRDSYYSLSTSTVGTTKREKMFTMKPMRYSLAKINIKEGVYSKVFKGPLKSIELPTNDTMKQIRNKAEEDSLENLDLMNDLMLMKLAEGTNIFLDPLLDKGNEKRITKANEEWNNHLSEHLERAKQIMKHRLIEGRIDLLRKWQEDKGKTDEEIRTELQSEIQIDDESAYAKIAEDTINDELIENA